MPLKLNVGASRKIADENYGSRGASINMEVELDSTLVAETAKLQERIRSLFRIVRLSLAEELHRAQDQRPSASNAPGQKDSAESKSGPARLATSKQIKALYAITQRQGTDLHKLLRERFDLEQPEHLSLKAASSLIDSLKSAAA